MIEKFEKKNSVIIIIKLLSLTNMQEGTINMNGHS